MQDARPALSAKVPLGHSAHVRSLDVVAKAVVYVPAMHGGLTDVHATEPSLDEYVAPSSHAAHNTSSVAEPAVIMPNPAGQVRHTLHVWSPIVLVKEPLAQSAHLRSLVVVATAVTYVPGAQSGLVGVHASRPALSE